MIVLQNNTTPHARSPTVATYKKKPVLHHNVIRDELVRQFRFIHDIPLDLCVGTTEDGLDAVLWADLGRHEGLRAGRHLEVLGFKLCVACVHSNSRRQKTAFYGGMRSEEGVLVFDKIPFKPREDQLEKTLEHTVARWSLFVDRYWHRYRELREFKLTPDEYRRLLVECGEDGILSWSRMGGFHDDRPDQETALSFLLRLSRHVGRQPAISHAPARSQPWSMHCGYTRVWELRS
jgi:hypothetical protein